MNSQNACPCQSSKTYEACCASYHRNNNAPTAETLMRSRYSAYVFSLVDYLVETTHPSNRAKNLKDEIMLTCKEVHWYGLEILSTWQGGVNDKVGKVAFRASFMQEDKLQFHQEHSRFKRFGKAWMYVDGDIKK